MVKESLDVHVDQQWPQAQIAAGKTRDLGDII